MTKYEAAVYHLIQSSHSHMTAEEIYRELRREYPKVVLATVYNNLNRLLADGKIRRVSVEGMADRYDRIVRHDHIVCPHCGKLMDIQFQDLTEALKKQFGDDSIFYDLKVFSLCPECRKKLGK